MSSIRHPLAALVTTAALGLAACGGGDTSGGSTGTGGGGDGVTIVAGDLFFEHDGVSSSDGDLAVSTPSGEVTLVLDNQGAAIHNIVIEDLGDEKVAEAEGGSQDRGTVTLEAGSYTFYCDVVGHRDAGMEGTITAG